ncbi:gag-Pol polyprotein [Trichonephila clavipes]|uniref:Gag-Pol polyprotein n=1 Tax=Trichonephila clavipes TaxID=2585209 RepID=A0A8X6T3S2_TRICX|nr:gag-Pol polyprotein [Trichonephila clavipes]
MGELIKQLSCRFDCDYQYETAVSSGTQGQEIPQKTRETLCSTPLTKAPKIRKSKRKPNASVKTAAALPEAAKARKVAMERDCEEIAHFWEEEHRATMTYRKKEHILKMKPVLASPVPPVTACTEPVKLSTYDGKTKWEAYKTQFSILSEANGWTEGVKVCHLEASFRGEAAEVLQALPNTERLNLNSLCNALVLRFDQKYSKDYGRLQMKTGLQKIREILQEYASKIERLDNLAFSDHPVQVREKISLQYFVDALKKGEIQKAVRMADVQDLKSVLLYALKLEAVTQASH